MNAAPEAVALRMRDRGDVSYAALDRLSNQIANWLTGEGVRPGDVVGLFHNKSLVAYASMLACLKGGFIYTNLDSDSPWERLRKIVLACRPARVLTFADRHNHVDKLAKQDIPTLNMQSPQICDSVARCSDQPHPAPVTLTGASPAYIMFTSGSTGMPKGAVMSHANLINFVGWVAQTFEIGPGDLLSGANPMYFDNSVFDSYASLFTGAALLPLTVDEVRDPRRIVQIVNASHCTIWFSVPSLLVYLLTTRALESDDFPSVRKLIFGGEGFPKPKLKQLFDMFGERIQFENVYGPTECTCICSAHQITVDDFQDMRSLTMLGCLADNFDYDILPVDTSDPDFGELFLKGSQVGLGYFNDSERTSQSFVQNPTHQDYRDIGYRTGDLVRRDERQQLHFKGRTDFQIKHMGYRIELEEIEAALATIPAVTECAVIYHQVAEGMGQIVGFAALSKHHDPEVDLISQVADIVPSYMVPRQIRILAALPKNANGKIDRNQLQQQTAGTP
ncbi:MAG: amino acid adenylation domain-containing protein [Fuerstiella sp.]|nr:amino acid adenylation domain-containing protein [Fuerstiella sp.]